MGVYDREYYREEQRGFNLGGDWSATVTLIAINAAIAVMGLFVQGDQFNDANWFTRTFELKPDLFHHPLNFWQLLTYGFIHSPTDIFHVLFNMVGLWIFGREVEVVYGKREFYKIYISLIILSGLFDQVVQLASQSWHPVVGASGAVMGLAVIFACHFPRRTLVLFPIPIPVPAYIFVSVYVLAELLMTTNHKDHVAHWVHLGGALFGFIFYWTGWNLFHLWPSKIKLRWPSKRPKFRIHRESDEDDVETDAPVDDYMTTGRIQARVDQLLAKISASGESSLTDEERQFLADASRRYQQRRR